ncbi:MAG: ATP-binding protein [Proteobacteria bacterium]|nr:ATP-binding protein [Pseudomonadota bacterium]
MPSIQKTFHVTKNDFIHAGEASIHVKNLLKSLNYVPDLVRRVAICGYEAEMNLVMHGGDGELSVDVNADRIIVDVIDHGQGIADVELAMQEGYSTAKDEYREMGFGAGMGLPNIKKNSDEMVITSEQGNGTHVKMVFFNKGLNV